MSTPLSSASSASSASAASAASLSPLAPLAQQAAVSWLAEVALHTHNAVVITDALGRTVWINPAFEAMTGFSLAAIQGHKPGAMLQGHETDPRTVALLRQLLTNRQPVRSVEILNYTADRKPYWVELDITPVCDASGNLSHFVSIQTLLSKQREADAALRLLQQRHQLALQAAGIGVWEVRPGAVGPELDARALAAVLGLAPSDAGPDGAEGFEGDGAPALLPWPDLPKALALWRTEVDRIQGSESRFELEVLVDTTAGEPRVLQILGQGLPSPASRITGVVIDRTDALRERLERDALRVEDMLKIERRDAFGRLQRDLRMPMNSLLGFVQLLRNDIRALGHTSLMERVERLESAGDQLLHLMDEVLEASARETERETQLQPVALGQALLSHLPKEVAVDLRLLDREEVYVWADPMLLRRALGMVTDARLSLGAMAGVNRMVVTAGADAMHIALVFEVATPEAAATPDGGLRHELLGRLVAAMGGEMKVTPLTQGRRIELSLRRSIGVVARPHAAAPSPRADGWQQRADVAGRVLYVEDDPGNVDLVRHALVARPSIELLTAPSVPAALQLLAQGPAPDLLLLDLVLPGPSGMSLLRDLRADPRFRDLPCVVLTALGDERQEQEARAEGANGYLTKPLRLTKLLTAVDHFLA